MEKMRVVIITLFLFIGAAVAEDAGIGKAVNPIAEEAGIGDAITPEEGKATNIQAYESPTFKKFVTHCSSHITQTCSGNDPLNHEASGINSPLFMLSFCLFDSMEKCLADHGASLKDSLDNNNLGSMSSLPGSIQNQPLLIETVKFRAVLKTCSHVSAQSCFTNPNVATSALAACLMPSLNQCVYPFTGGYTPPPPLFV